MSIFKKTPAEKSGLEKAIDEVHAQMALTINDPAEYAKHADNLTKLYKLREHDSKKRVSPDTLAMVAGNLAGIMLIVGHERAHVVTSKALTFVKAAVK